MILIQNTLFDLLPPAAKKAARRSSREPVDPRNRLIGVQNPLDFYRDVYEARRKAEFKRYDDFKRAQALMQLAGLKDIDAFVRKCNKDKSYPRWLTRMMDTDCDSLTKQQVEILDAVIVSRRNFIRDAWTPEREAEARGIDLSLKRLHCESDGRFHAPVFATELACGVDEEDDYDAMRELLW